MARSRKPKHFAGNGSGTPHDHDTTSVAADNTTGKYIVIFSDDADHASVGAAMNSMIGVKTLAVPEDFDDQAFSAEQLNEGTCSFFPTLKMALVNIDDDQLQSLSAASLGSDGHILAVEPEYIANAIDRLEAAKLDFLRGYRDAVNHLYDELAGPEHEEATLAGGGNFLDTNEYTWGLQATKVNSSRYSGQGIKLAVLDTGFDLNHPDFQGRQIASKSFVLGQAVQDGNGHGTHCVGTSCGPLKPQGTRRYGIAYGAQIHVGKVLSNMGSGGTGGIIAGIEWAISQGCKIVSMSLAVDIDQKVQQYEVPIQRALNAGTLIVAAASNNAMRPGNLGFVGAPANSEAAMAIAAVDSQLRIASFSPRSSSITGKGGRIDIAAPGVNVFSSWPMRAKYRSLQGTSMATPHVAGIAALWAQATGESGPALWARVLQNALPLSASSADVGAGLVQAPQ